MPLEKACEALETPRETTQPEMEPEPEIEKSHKPKKPRGRPPIGAVLVNGKWEMTENSILREAARLEVHRLQCRQRYHRNRNTLMTHMPELFKKRRIHTETQATL